MAMHKESRLELGDQAVEGVVLPFFLLNGQMDAGCVVHSFFLTRVRDV